MKQDITCNNGKCVDNNNLSCDEKHDNMKDIIECEELEKQKIKEFEFREEG